MTRIKFPEEIVAEAIKKRHLLRFEYGEIERIVEPYIMGINEANNIVCRAFQVAAEGEVSKPYGWKMFDVYKMGHIRVTPHRWFGEREGYNPVDPDIVEVQASINLTCPRCGKFNRVVPILFGYPPPEWFELEQQKKLILGGCCVSNDDPSFFCKRCKIAFTDDYKIVKPYDDPWKDY